MTDKTILIGMPTGSGYIHWMMVASLMRLESPLRVGFFPVPKRRTDRARNEIAMKALKQGYDYLLFLDDDNPVPPDTINKLLEDDKDIVSVPIVTRRAKKNGEHYLCAYQGKVYDGIRIYHHVKKFEGDGYLHRVDICGMGCTLIKRKVLQTLYEKYSDLIFEYTETVFDKTIDVEGKQYKRRTMSEDFEFCERAVDAGLEVWLDTRIRPIHLGEVQFLQWSDEV